MTIYLFLKDGTREQFKSDVISIEKAAASVSSLISTIITDDQHKSEIIYQFIDDKIVIPSQVENSSTLIMTWRTALNLNLSISLSNLSFEKYLSFPNFKYLEHKKYLMITIKSWDDHNRPKQYKKVLAILSDSAVLPVPEYFDKIYQKKICCLF